MEKPTFKSEFLEVLDKSLKNKGKIAISMVVVLFLGLIYLYLRGPRFESFASITLNEDNISPTSLVKQFSLANVMGGSGSVYNEMQMLSSHTTMMETVKKLGLNVTYQKRDGILKNSLQYPDSYIRLNCDSTIPDTLSKTINFKVNVSANGKASASAKCAGKTIGKTEGNLPLTLKTTWGDFEIEQTETTPHGEEFTEKIRFKSYSAAAEDYLEKVEFNIPSKLADVVEISYVGKNKELCLDLLWTVIDEYNARGIEESRQKGQQTLKFIDERLITLSKELSSSESDIQNFKESNRLSDIPTDVQYALEKRAIVEKELLEAESQAEIIRMTIDYLSNPENSNALLPVLFDSDSEKSLIEQYNELILKRMQLLKSAREGSETLRRLDEQISAMKKNVGESLKRTGENLRVKIGRLQAQINSTNSKIDQIPSQEKIYRDIFRQQAIQEQIYVYLLEQREETAMGIINTTGRGQIINRPYVSSLPSQKSGWFVIIICLFVGFLIIPFYYYIGILSQSDRS